MKKWTCCSWRSVAKTREAPAGTSADVSCGGLRKSRALQGTRGSGLVETLPDTGVEDCGSTVRVAAGEVYLRFPRWVDGRALMAVRARSQQDIARWEPDAGESESTRGGTCSPAQQWGETYHWFTEGRRLGVMVTFVIMVNGSIAGQVMLSNVERGAVQGATVGYWVDSQLAGGGVATAAAGLALDYAFQVMGLHRVQATVHPDNAASRRVLEKIGMRQEGVLRHYMRIGGRYMTHELWAVTAAELPHGAVGRLVEASQAFRA